MFRQIAFVFLLLAIPAFALSGEECLTAARTGSVGEIQSMLSQHSPKELFRVRDTAGRGLLHHCLKRGQAYWGPLIESGWLITEEKGWTPQHEAALAGNLEALKALKEKGAVLSVAEPFNGGTPLHVAAFNGHFEVVKFLVGAGVQINARDKEGWTAWSQARDQGFPDIVDWLKKNGATR